MAKIEVEGDKAKITMYEGVGGSSSEIELTRGQIIDSAVNLIPGMSELNSRDFKQTDSILNTYLDTLDKMNEENNG